MWSLEKEQHYIGLRLKVYKQRDLLHEDIETCFQMLLFAFCLVIPLYDFKVSTKFLTRLIFSGHASCIKLLLEHKADATARMVGGWTPAHCAAEEGHVNCLRALQEHGGAVCLKDDTGDSPRRVAEIYGHVDCVEFLKRSVSRDFKTV